jgi:hypothetical protein
MCRASLRPVATALARYVTDGGGLLVAAGAKAQADFYNTWKTEGDAPFLPATIADPVVATASEAFSPSAQTLTHPALAKVADTAKSDFSGTVITNYRPQTIPEALAKDASVGARLNNGEILLSSRKEGRGQVVLLGIPLDLSAGNLVTRQAFLPFIHELVYHLADPASYQLNLEPGWEVNLGLAGKRGRALGEGLIGRYFASHGATEPDLHASGSLDPVQLDERQPRPRHSRRWFQGRVGRQDPGARSKAAHLPGRGR